MSGDCLNSSLEVDAQSLVRYLFLLDWDKYLEVLLFGRTRFSTLDLGVLQTLPQKVEWLSWLVTYYVRVIPRLPILKLSSFADVSVDSEFVFQEGLAFGVFLQSCQQRHRACCFEFVFVVKHKTL